MNLQGLLTNLLVVWNDINSLKIDMIMTKDIKLNKNSAKTQQIMQDNPDLFYEFVRQLLIAQAQVAAGRIEPYKFG